MAPLREYQSHKQILLKEEFYYPRGGSLKKAHFNSHPQALALVSTHLFQSSNLAPQVLQQARCSTGNRYFPKHRQMA